MAKKRKAFITGITGQDGSYLAEILLEKGYDVYGLARTQVLVPGVTVFRGDVTDTATLRDAIRASEPEEVYNLAAQPLVAESFALREETLNVNAFGIVRLFDALKDLGKLETVRVCHASSAEIFAGVEDEDILDESTLILPRTPYGVAKVFAHHFVQDLRRQGLHASNAIFFNHESPRRKPEFVTQKVATGVVRTNAGLQDVIELGNLDSRRDWGFAGDYMEAMWLMLQQDAPDDYVVATGEAHSVRELVEIAFSRVGITDWERYVEVDPQLKRKERPVMVGNPTKAKTVLDWEPRVSFSELICGMVDSAAERMTAQAALAKEKMA